ncbi:MAG: UDP-glucose 4-epimerase GalE [Chthoniobacteraceae bacterium]
MSIIMVTGGAGYIGSVCVEHLLDAGHDVVVFDNLSEGHRRAVDERARLIVGDLQNRADIASAMAQTRPDAVMHFAADALVGESMRNPSKYFRNNVGAGLNLLDAMVECGVGKLIFSSTCATFGMPDRVPIDETLPQKPINPYGESKFLFEKILRWYGEIHGLSYAALRYFNAAGASEKFGEDHRIETHLVPNILKVALGQKDCVEVFGSDYETQDGTCIRDYIHLSDLASAHMLALKVTGQAHYNLGTGGGNSVMEVIETCRTVTGRPIPVVTKARRPGDPARLIASSERIFRDLGWEPKFRGLSPIIESAWRWHLRHPNGYGD